MDKPFLQQVHDTQNAQKAQRDAAQTHNQTLDTIRTAGREVVSALKQVQKVEVTNQLDPKDLQSLSEAVNALVKAADRPEPDDTKVLSALERVETALKAIPDQIKSPVIPDEVTIKNQIDLSEVVKAVKSQKLDPKITVKAPIVETSVNLKPVTDKIGQLLEAFKSLPQESPSLDTEPLEMAVSKVEDAIKNIIFPVPEAPFPFMSSDFKGVQVQLTADGKVPVDAAFSGTLEGASSFSDASDTDQKGLVDADRHVQVDVLTMPDVSVDTTGLALAANQQTDALTDIELRAADVKVTLDGESVPVTGTFWQATQPVSAASLPLPSGAATSAKQPALGTAGTASSDVLTVQGIASMTALKVDGSAVTQPVSGTFWQATQPVSLASVPSHAVTNAGTFAVQNTETRPATPTLTNVTMTGSSVTLQASNTSRRNLMIYNDSGVDVYVKLGSAASSTSFTVKMADQSYYELPAPVYTGIVTALGASGSVRVTQVV